MCDPVTIAGAALSGLGTMMSMKQQSDYVKAQNAENEKAAAYSRSMRSAEIARQDEMARQTKTEVMDPAIERNTLDAQQAALNNAADRRQRDFNTFVPNVNDPNRIAGLLPQDNAQIVRDQAKADLARYLANARTQIANKAKLEAFGDLGAGNAINAARDSSNILQMGNLRRASLGINQAETSVPAAQVTPGDGTLASLLTTAGQIGMYAGARGWNPFGSGASLGANMGGDISAGQAAILRNRALGIPSAGMSPNIGLGGIY